MVNICITEFTHMSVSEAHTTNSRQSFSANSFCAIFSAHRHLSQRQVQWCHTSSNAQDWRQETLNGKANNQLRRVNTNIQPPQKIDLKTFCVFGAIVRVCRGSCSVHLRDHFQTEISRIAKAKKKGRAPHRGTRRWCLRSAAQHRPLCPQGTW